MYPVRRYRVSRRIQGLQGGTEGVTRDSLVKATPNKRCPKFCEFLRMVDEARQSKTFRASVLSSVLWPVEWGFAAGWSGNRAVRRRHFPREPRRAGAAWVDSIRAIGTSAVSIVPLAVPEGPSRRRLMMARNRPRRRVEPRRQRRSVQGFKPPRLPHDSLKVRV